MGRRGGRGPYRLADDADEDGVVVTARSRAVDAQLTRLTGDVRVKAAALVGASFGIDPVVLLDERDPLRTLIRIAAHNHLQNEKKRANK